MDELNLHLQSLIQGVCTHTPSTLQHRQALNRLLRVILKSGCIWRPSVGDVYEENLYEEALNKTMFNLTKTLCDKYNPNQGSFFAWFNTCLRHKYTDEIRAVKRDRARIQSRWQSDEMKFADPLDRVHSPIDATLLLQTWESFVEWIAKDSGGILSSCHIENNPKANCQLIAHLRLVVGKEWQGIAVEVGSSRGAITSHWCRKCEFLLREWLSTNQKLFGEDNYD